MKEKIGIIGLGNMGRAIAERIKTHCRVSAFDRDKTKTRNLKAIAVEKNIEALVAWSDATILAVKPQDIDVVLNAIKDYAGNKLVISIAAGIPAGYIEKKLGKVKVVRAMPNLPAKIGKGMICLSRGKFAKEKDLGFACQLFDYLGKTLVIKEKMMDAATAVSGSGPGFFYDLIENLRPKEIKDYAENCFLPQLRSSAVAVKFSDKEAAILAGATTLGAIALLKKEKLSPVKLKERVASKGGTTEAGLEVLHKGGSLTQAVKAALKRAKELARR